jgi:hypothetical protein
MSNTNTPLPAIDPDHPMASTQESNWVLHKPRIAIRVGVLGSNAAVASILKSPHAKDSQPLDLLFGGLRKTLQAVRAEDRDRNYPSSNSLSWTEPISILCQGLGYRVDKASLQGFDNTVYLEKEPLLRLLSIQPEIIQILTNWRGESCDTELTLVELDGSSPASGIRGLDWFAFNLLVHHSDLLIAVWDSSDRQETERIDGMMRKAIREQCVVIAVRLVPNGLPQIAILDAEGELDLVHSNRVQPEICLPSCATGDAISEVDFNKLRLQFNPTFEFPDAEANEREIQSRSGAHLYHPRAVFLKMVRNQQPPTTFVATQFWGRYKRCTNAIYRRFHRTNHDAPPTPTPSDPLQPTSEPWNSLVAQTYAIADGPFSMRHGDTYRGGIVASYILAVFAVTLAGLGSWLHFWHSNSHEAQPALHAAGIEHGLEAAQGIPEPSGSSSHFDWLLPVAGGVLILLALLESAIVLWMFLLSIWSSKRGWRIQFTDSRMLAEGTRIWKYLGAMGIHTPLPKLPHYLRGDWVAPHPDSTWSLWYLRAMVREAPIYLDPSDSKRSFDQRTKILRFLAQDQIGYHTSNASKQHFNHEVIEFLTTLLFIAVILCIGWHLVEIVTGWNLYAQIGIVVCLGGPLLIALLNGFESQLEIQRLRQRSNSVQTLLQERIEELEKIEKRVLASGTASSEDQWHLMREGMQIGAILMDETAGWAMLYRPRDIHTG